MGHKQGLTSKKKWQGQCLMQKMRQKQGLTSKKKWRGQSALCTQEVAVCTLHSRCGINAASLLNRMDHLNSYRIYLTENLKKANASSFAFGKSSYRENKWTHSVPYPFLLATLFSLIGSFYLIYFNAIL